MDHALDILNYIQRLGGKVTFERGGVDIHEFEILEDGTGRALVWGKDGFAVVEVVMGIEAWNHPAGAVPGPILYGVEVEPV